MYKRRIHKAETNICGNLMDDVEKGYEWAQAFRLLSDIIWLQLRPYSPIGTLLESQFPYWLHFKEWSPKLWKRQFCIYISEVKKYVF